MGETGIEKKKTRHRDGWTKTERQRQRDRQKLRDKPYVLN